MPRSSYSLPAIIAPDQGGFCPAEPGQDDLLLELALSVWVRGAELRLVEALGTMLELREAICEVAGFDVADEPIPLVPRDDRLAVVNVARYLAVLAERAARATGEDRAELVTRAFELLGTDSEPLGQIVGRLH